MTDAPRLYPGDYVIPPYRPTTAVAVPRFGLVHCRPDAPLRSIARLMAANRVCAEGSAAAPVVTIEATSSVTEAAALIAERAASHLLIVTDAAPVAVAATLDIAIAWWR